jgi:hypothetical protein
MLLKVNDITPHARSKGTLYFQKICAKNYHASAFKQKENMPKDLAKIKVEICAEAPHAYLVTNNGVNRQWIAKANIKEKELSEKLGKQYLDLTIPRHLAEEKKFIMPCKCPYIKNCGCSR